MLRLWIMSDLHLELTRGWDLPSGDARPAFDVMIVAGDLVPRLERGVRWLLERVSDHPVIVLAGNHEFYHGDIDRTVEKAMQAAAGTNVHVLQDRTITLGSTIFHGSTMWTDFNLFGDQRRAMVAAGARMNDYRRIRKANHQRRFTPADALARHMRSRALLERELRKPRDGKKFVAVTHHAPIREDLDRPMAERDVLEAAYRSDLTSLMVPAPDDGRGALHPPDLWVFGHTHQSVDKVVGSSVRVVSNAKGYGPLPPAQPAWDNADFKPDYVIEI